MITLSMRANGDLEVIHHDVAPTVYLDHWALRAFSESRELDTRLAAGLRLRGGTLALSWVNVAEFVRVTDERPTRQAEELIDANLPRIFLIEVDPFAVINRENQLLAGGSPLPPHGDEDFLRALVALRPESPRPLTARDLFDVMRRRGEELTGQLDGLADTFIARVEALRDKLQSDEQFRAAVGRPAAAAPIQRATRDILRELIRGLMIDERRRLTRNDAFDFFHAVVPIAYCEMVLLDGYWEEQVNRVRARFKRSGAPVRIGSVFSRRRNGVDRFIEELESAPSGSAA